MRNVHEMTAIKHPLRKNRVAVSSTTATTIILMTALLAVVVVLPRPNHAFITPNQSTAQHSLVTIETRRIESSRIPFEIRGQASRLYAGKKGSGKKGKNKVDAGKGFGNNDKNKVDVEVEVDEKIEINNSIEDIITINNNQEKTSEITGFGDPLREANGIRASIHPTAINAIAESLKARAFQIIKKKSNNNNDDDDDEKDYFRVTDTVGPLQVMVTAGQFASNAIQKRQEASVDTNDGMKMNNREEECVAGRVMGVIMRLDDLENELVERTMDVDWVAKYDEWSSFGVLEDESKLILKNESEDGKSEDDNDKDVMMKKVHEKIIDDPLFCMNRAECLLAIFIQEVEFPQFQKLNETAPDESKIDFLDTDRLQVVIPSSSISEE
jgi:hypothetical protein